ncbi:MAG: hypothetical protein KDB32_10775 [Planctomycetes bacterium]|nr:hypothetical protein [Planctomycetota bacterium]
MNYLAIVVFILAGPVSACCMVPRDYPGDVDQSAQRVVVVHRAPDGDTPGYQEMIIRVQPFFQGSETNPTTMTWVVTVPSKPLRYDQASVEALDAGPEFQKKLFQLARDQWANKTGFEWPEWLSWMSARDASVNDAKAAGAIEEDALVTVGPYNITPVRAKGAEAVQALNDYLGQRGFPKEDPAHLQYFIDNEFTFLCINVTPPQGQTALGRELELPPLVIGFETPEPYYPGKFSSRQGNFKLDLTVITDSPLNTQSVGELRKRMNAKNYGYVQLVNLFSVQALPETLTSALSERVTTREKQRWYVNRIESEGFNDASEGGIAAWETDVFFKVGTIHDEIPGFWYYGDQEISWYERLVREHAMAFFVTMGMLFFLSLYIKVRINRKRAAAEKAA